MVHLTEVQTLAISSGERIFAKPKEDGVNYHLLLQNSVLNPDVGIYSLVCRGLEFTLTPN